MIEIRQIILKRATELFAQFGLKKTSVDQIAENAGIAKGTIYNYFKSKEELFTAIIRSEAEKFVDTITGALKDCKTSEEKLRTFFLTEFDLLFEYINLFNTAHKGSHIHELMTSIGKETDEYYQKMHGIMTSIFEEGIRDGSFKSIDYRTLADIVVELFKNMGFPIPFEALRQERKVIADKINFMIDLLLSGIRK
ncbi:MAG: TetR/AcrR family transcriptional regulator [Spirochaetota bacterium]